MDEFHEALARYFDTVIREKPNEAVRKANIEKAYENGREFLRIMKGVKNVQKVESNRDRCEGGNS